MQFFVRSAVTILTAALICFPGTLTAGTHSSHNDWSNEPGWLGITIQDITEGIKEASELKTEEGVLVNDVMKDSPAEKSGLEAGDVVLKYNGADIKDSSQFIKLVRETKPGESARIILFRDGKEKEISVEVGEKPKKLGHHEIFGEKELWGEGEPWILMHKEGSPHAFEMPRLSGGHIGVLVENMNPQLAAAFGVKEVKGALVLEAEEGGPAYEAGIRGGDIILKVDDSEIDDTGELRSSIREKKEGDEVELTVIRKKKRKTFTVSIEESHPFPSFDKDIEILKFDDELGHLRDLRIDIQGSVEEELARLKEEMESLKVELEGLKESLKDKITN